MNFNISPSPFTVEQQVDEDTDQNPFSRQFLYNSMQNHTAGYCDRQLYKLGQHHHEQEDNFGFHVGSSSYNVKNKAEPGLKLTLWNGEDHHVPDESHVINEAANHNPVQWVHSKIRLMQQKTKNSNSNLNPNHVTLKINSSTVAKMIEDDQKILQASHSWETDSSSSISYSNPIRVCSDCNTTKTPLWRSGPKGPKSLCNACGIRQRKARRAAMAAASAAANGMAVVLTDEPPTSKPIKLKNKEKITKKANTPSFKKHRKTAATAATSPPNGDARKKLDLEDFLINLSKNLAFRFRVFPQDEKDAAILLMALSSGLIHGQVNH